MTKILHIEIDKCEDCLFRQWYCDYNDPESEDEYECDGTAGYWCYFPDSEVWWVTIIRDLGKDLDIPRNEYRGNFPEKCPLKDK
jgi:hypothetical protein